MTSYFNLALFMLLLLDLLTTFLSFSYSDAFVQAAIAACWDFVQQKQ